MKSLMRQQTTLDFPHDIGLLPGTIIQAKSAPRLWRMAQPGELGSDSRYRVASEPLTTPEADGGNIIEGGIKRRKLTQSSGVNVQPAQRPAHRSTRQPVIAGSPVLEGALFKSPEFLMWRDNFRMASKYYRLLIRHHVTNFVTRQVYRFLTKPRIHLQRRADTIDTAILLHRRFNEAMAEGDHDSIRDLCLTGLMQDCEKQLATRETSTRFRWTVVRYGFEKVDQINQSAIGSNDLPSYTPFIHRILSIPFPYLFPPLSRPTILSHRAAVLPRYDQLVPGRAEQETKLPPSMKLGITARLTSNTPNGLQQAIILIPSIQTLRRYEKGLNNPSIYAPKIRVDDSSLIMGEKVPGTGEERAVEEVIVLQRKLEDGVEGAWKIWGITERPSRVSEVIERGETSAGQRPEQEDGTRSRASEKYADGRIKPRREDRGASTRELAGEVNRRNLSRAVEAFTDQRPDKGPGSKRHGGSLALG